MKYFRTDKTLTGKALSAHTVAAFLAVQGVQSVDELRADAAMDARLLKFLQRDRMLDHWSTNGWMRPDPYREHYALTDAGLRKIRDRVQGRARAQNVTTDQVAAALAVIRGEIPTEAPVAFEAPNPLADGVQAEPAQADTSSPAAMAPATDEKTMAAIWSRRGQGDFRQRLLSAYGSTCVISGCDAVAVLEAAHITPYATEHDYSLSNGLLLRADLHTLFDLHLLSIDPDTGSVCMAPSTGASYACFNGARLRTPQIPSASPDSERLRLHFARFRHQLGGSGGDQAPDA